MRKILKNKKKCKNYQALNKPNYKHFNFYINYLKMNKKGKNQKLTNQNAKNDLDDERFSRVHTDAVFLL